MVSYKPLLKLLIDRDMTRLALRDAIGFNNTTLSRIGKNQYISLMNLDRICQYFNCQLSDIVEILPDPEEEPEQETQE